MQVFFSYAREDADFALKLASDLRSSGANVWIDKLDVRPGDHWDRAVETALKQCPAFLIVLSPRSVGSQNVMDEVHFALEEGKKILPIMLEACDLPFRLRRLQYIDFTVAYEEPMRVCQAHLQSLFGDRQSGSSSAETATRHPSAAAKPATSSIVRTQSRERLDGIRFLWVDDVPSNNRYERTVLHKMGAEIHVAIDTKDAMLVVNEMRFDVIISDMARPSAKRAGYALLSKLRKANFAIPVIFYTSSNAPEHQREAIRRGALGCTNNPHDLLEMALTVTSRVDLKTSRGENDT